MLLDLLTPVTKSFPAEWGFESTSLSIQIHGGYGYSSEYLPEAWMRDQKLNTLHEGTTGIQSLDLLGRKVVAGGGATLRTFLEEVGYAVRAAEGIVDEELLRNFQADLDRIAGLTSVLGMRGLSGDLLGMLGHSVDYLFAFAILVVGWQHLRLWTLAAKKLEAGDAPGEEELARLEGSIAAARYWLATEMPRVRHLADLCEEGERSYLDMSAEQF
jgi:butyryl-CoA dehydrogenase